MTVFVINIRYMLMSLSLSQKLEGMPVLKRLLLANGVTDEIFFPRHAKGRSAFRLVCRRVGGGPLRRMGARHPARGTGGRCVARALSSALGIALYAMFIAIVVPPSRRSKAVAVTALVAVGLACLFRYLPGLRLIPSGWALILAGGRRGGVCGAPLPGGRLAGRGRNGLSRTLYWAAGGSRDGCGDLSAQGLPLTLLRRPVKSRFLRSFLYYMPFAVLGAMTFPAILYATATPWSALAGFAVALLLSWFGLSLLPVALASTAMVFAVEWAMRLGWAFCHETIERGFRLRPESPLFVYRYISLPFFPKVKISS